MINLASSQLTNGRLNSYSLSYFQLITGDFYDTRAPDTIYYMVFTAAGAEVKKYGIWVIVPFPLNGAQYQLDKNNNSYSGYIGNQSVDSGEYREYSGYYKLTVADLTVDSYGTTDLYASYKVRLTPGFEAKRGSTCHIFNSDTAFVCTDYSWYDFSKQCLISNSCASIRQDIELKFGPVCDSQPHLFPNPTQGIFTISLENTNLDGPFEVRLFDARGLELFTLIYVDRSATLDLTGKPPGLYILIIKNTNGKVIKRIIKN